VSAIFIEEISCLTGKRISLMAMDIH